MAWDDLPPLPISRLNDPGMVRLMCSYVTYAVTRYAGDFHMFKRAQRPSPAEAQRAATAEDVTMMPNDLATAQGAVRE